MEDLNAMTHSPVMPDRGGLPAWSYTNPEMLEMEKEHLFRRHWQLICHVSDVPNPGDFIAADMVGERALVVRGQDGEVRAFHNLCRHRGSRVVAEDKGHCRSAIICPFHGWVYNLDGTLRGVSQPDSLPDLDPVRYGLKPVETEIWHGFVFVRFKPGPQPSIREILAEVEDEIAGYGLDTLQPNGAGFSAEMIDANWKCVRDVDNEGYHVPMAHPGLHDLYGGKYQDETYSGGVSRAFGPFRDGPSRLWSVRNYRNILPEVEALPESHRRAWLYVGLFPNLVFGLYPDSVIFYHEFPLAIGRSVQRSGCYRRAEESREMRAARYLSGRIDRITGKEDIQLIEWAWESAFSSGFDGVVLTDLEIGVRSYHDALRDLFPVLNEDEPPAGMLDRRNAELLSAAGGAASSPDRS